MRKQSLRQAANRYLKTDNRGHIKDKKRRAFVILKMIDDLFAVGDVPLSWQHLKSSHVHELVQHWKKQKLKPATIIWYMVFIRQFLMDMDCHLTDIDNQSLKLTLLSKRKKKTHITPNAWQTIEEPCPRFILALQTHFGLTFGEAIRFIPDIHSKEESLWITREIAFNSEDRTIPFRNDIQQGIMTELMKHTDGDRCLLKLHGEETIRVQWRKCLSLKKLPSNKSYRHLYAQILCKELSPTLGNYQTNWLIRDEMGIKSRNTLWLYLNE